MSPPTLHRVPVVVATPAHSGLVGPLSYQSELALAPGTLVRVPLGKREVMGVVWDAEPGKGERAPSDRYQERPVAGVLDGLAPLPGAWRQLVGFAARYYQRGLGEVAEGEEGEDRGVERDGEEEGQKHVVWGLGQGGGGVK